MQYDALKMHSIRCGRCFCQFWKKYVLKQMLLEAIQIEVKWKGKKRKRKRSGKIMQKLKLNRFERGLKGQTNVQPCSWPMFNCSSKHRGVGDSRCIRRTIKVWRGPKCVCKSSTKNECAGMYPNRRQIKKERAERSFAVEMTSKKLQKQTSFRKMMNNQKVMNNGRRCEQFDYFKRRGNS